MNERRIAYEIKKTGILTTRYVLNNLKAHHSLTITPIQIEILFLLADHHDGCMVQKDIESALELRKSTVSGILDTMIRNGLVKKENSKNDLRSKIIMLTESGISEYQTAYSETMDMEDQILQGISNEELDTFFHVLDKVKENISE